MLAAAADSECAAGEGGDDADGYSRSTRPIDRKGATASATDPASAPATEATSESVCGAEDGSGVGGGA